VSDDLQVIREGLRDRCRGSGMTAHEARVRAERSVRRCMDRIESGMNPEPTSRDRTPRRQE
jgi:hypothetical protein